MIPLPVSDDALHTLSPEVLQHTAVLTHYFAEDLRTARRFIKQLHPTLVIETLQFSLIDKHKGADKALLRQWLKEGHSVGVMSESGCPGIADPGAELAAQAHAAGAPVVPLTGPSSLLLALMASGLNGQSFAFAGYLPVKDPERSKKIKDLEARSAKENQTQLFIETPYRNNAILADLLKHLNPNTRLCIAQDVTGAKANISTRIVAEWKRAIPAMEKLPTVFLILA